MRGVSNKITKEEVSNAKYGCYTSKPEKWGKTYNILRNVQNQLYVTGVVIVIVGAISSTGGLAELGLAFLGVGVVPDVSANKIQKCNS